MQVAAWLFYYPEGYEGGLGDGFVDLSFPQVPVTFLIIIRYFESPATTFGLVKHIRLGRPLHICVYIACNSGGIML